MGMAASQARYLSLQARMSNVEYQGQQINQERTILSQQATALYNSLLDMQVPTPPSTSDYTTVSYSGVDGATKFTLGNVKPQGDKYIVEINTKYTGETLSKESGVKKVEKSPTTSTDSLIAITGDYAIRKEQQGELVVDKTYPIEYLSKIYVKVGDREIKKDEQGNPVTVPVCLTLKEAGIDYYTISDDGKTFTLNNTTIPDPEHPETPKYKYEYINSESGNSVTWYKDPKANYEGWKIGGNYAYRFDDAQKAFPDFDWDGYKSAIENTYGTGEGSKTYLDFYVYFDTTSGYAVPKFVLEKDLQTIADETEINNQYTETYEFLANGTVTKTEAKEQCTLTFDSQGRIASIGIPKYGRKADGTINPEEIVGYTIVPLTASTTTDTAAYDDAYNQYEYNQYLYDKKVQEINAKTEIIQAEDRSLELRLQRLDNERTQLKTEMEAVKKVINENIDNSYKTFSG